MNHAAQVLARLKGPVVPLNLCFNEDGSVNYPAVTTYVDWLAEEQVPVILLTYGSSEFRGLPDEELCQVTAAVSEANAGRSLFIASTGMWKPSQTREFLQFAAGVGVDAVKVHINPALPATR